MAETENAAKRTREAPRGPVKPEPAPVEAEQESEARARQLVGLLRAESAAAPPPDEGNGNGQLVAYQRSSDGNGNGNGQRAVRAADLKTLQRLAGNAAVSELMSPSAGPAVVQRAPVEQAPPKPISPPPPEQMTRVEPADRKAAKREITQAVKAWMAADPTKADKEGAEGDGGSEDVAGEEAESATGGPTPATEAGGEPTPGEADEATADASSPAVGVEGEAGAEGEASETTPNGPGEAAAGALVDEAGPPTVSPATAALSAGSGAEPADAGPHQQPAVAAQASTDAGPRRAARERRPVPPPATRAATEAPSPARTATPRAATATSGAAISSQVGGAHGATPTATQRPGATSSAPIAASTVAASDRSGPARPADSTATGTSPVAASTPPVAAPREALAPGSPTATAATSARPTAEAAGSADAVTVTRAEAAPGPDRAGQSAEGQPRPTRTPTTPPALRGATAAVEATSVRQAPGDTASEDEAMAQETSERGPREMAERERFDDHEGQEKGPLAQREGRGQADSAVAPGGAVADSRVTREAPKGRRSGPRSSGGSPKGKEALAAWQGAAGGAVGGVKPADMSATEGAKGAVARGAKTITSTRESTKPDYESEAKKVVPPTPEPPEREKMMDFTAPRGAITSIRKVGETRLQSRTLKEAPAPPALPTYITAESFVPPDMSAQLEALERQAAEATGGEKVELDKKASELRAKIQALKDAKGVASGGEEISIEGEAAASAEPPEAAEDRAVVAAALSELADQQDAVVTEVVKKARVKVDPGNLSDPAKTAIDDHRSSIASELTTELQGIASAAGIVDQDLDAKIVAGKAKARDEGQKAKQETETAATEGKEELKAQGKKETGEQSQAAAAVKEDAEAKVKAIEGGPEPDDIEAKVTEYLDKTITTGNKAKTAIASAVKKMTTKLDDKATTKKTFFSRTGMKRSDAVRNYWKTELPGDENRQEAYRKGEEEAVSTMAWMRTGKKGTDSEVGLIKNAVAAEQKSLDALVDSTVDLARNTIRDWGAEQEGTTRSWWEELWDDFMDWWDDVGTSADGWEEQQNAETRDTIITDAKAIDAIVTAKKEDIDKVKDEQLEGMDSERRAIIEKYLAMGGSNTIQLVVMLTRDDITKRRIGQAVGDVDEQIANEWDWSDVDTICKSRNSAWPGAVSLASQILAGTGTSKVDKQKVFDGLAGAKSALERKALQGAFAHLAPEGSEQDLDKVLEARLSFDDEDRALALRAGKTDEADAAAIEAALSLTSDNFAPDTESITKVLRGKSPAEIDAIKRAYKEKYGDDLDEVLGETWFYDSEESDMVEALAKGDTDLADAAEVHDALKNLGTDEAQYNKVFDNIRSEVKAQALKEGMSPAEVDYEIKRRTEAVSKAYEEKYGQSLKEAVDEDFDGTEQQLAEAYLSGDADKIDATKALDEVYSFNSDDDSLEATVRNQKAKAEDYYKQYYASKQAQLRERRDAGLISKEAYVAGMAEVSKEQKEKQDQQIDAMTVANTKKLRQTYSDVSGGRNLDVDIYSVSQGASNDELTALLGSDGVLSDADELHYALAGAGTDEEMVRKLLYGRTPGQIQDLKRAYEQQHGPGSFDRDIRSEMDWGRDDEQILLMLEHDTSTPEGKLAYLKAAAELERSGLLYDDDDDPVGTSQAIKDLEKQLEEYRAIESDPTMSDAQKAAAKTLLDMQMGGAESSLKEFGELKDAEIDEWVDKVKMGLVTIPGFQFLLLDDALLAGPMKMVLGGGTADTGQLLVEMGMSVIDIALTVATIASGGTAAPATVALSTLIKQGAYREVAKRIVVELGKQALESMVMAAIELSLTEKAWDSHDSVDVLAEQAMTDFVVSLAIGGVIDMATGALSPNVHIDADGRIVADADGPKVDADGGRVDADGGRVDADDPEADLDRRLPDADDSGTPRTDEAGGGPGKTDVDDGGSTRADDDGGGRRADDDAGGATKADDGGGGTKADIDDTGGGGDAPKADDGGGGKKGGGDDAGGGGKGEGPGKVDPEAELAAKAGMDPKTVDFLKEFSDQLGLRLQFRPTTKAAPGQIAGGAKAKVEIAKMKTANSADRLLTDGLDLNGADLGKVVLFEPHHPMFRPEGDPRRQAFDALDADGKQAVHARYEQRLAEWDELNPDKNPFFKDDSGLDGKPALKMDGPFVQVQGIEGDYSFMTGDHDLFDVSFADGRPMTKDEYDAIIASLRHSGVNVEHGAHITWPRDRPQDFNPDPPPAGVGPEKALKNREAYEKILGEHTKEGSLIEIGPGGVRETAADPLMPEWDSNGTVTPGFVVPDSPMPGSGKTGGDTGGPDGGPTGGPEGGTSAAPDGGKAKGPDNGTGAAPDGGKAEVPDGGTGAAPDGGKAEGPEGGAPADVDAHAEVDTSQWDKFVEELQEDIDAAMTPHPAHEGEIAQITPDQAFDTARTAPESLSAQAQSEYAFGFDERASKQSSTTPIERTPANQVAGGDIIDSGAMGGKDPSLGVFHHDFDGTKGVMKVFSTTDPNHRYAFAKELSAARAADETGYVRFLGEFDAANASGNNLTPARALGFGWQPGKSLDKLDDLLEKGDIDAYSRIKPHTIDQVNDFARQMADRGFVLGGDYQFMVDIDGNVRPMDLEVFRPLPPPGPKRDEMLDEAAGWLSDTNQRLTTMMAPRDPRVHQVPAELRETQDLADFDAEQTGAWERPNLDETQKHAGAQQDPRAHDAPAEVRERFDAATTPHPAHRGEVDQVAPEEVFEALKSDSGRLAAKAQYEYGAAHDPRSLKQASSTPIERTEANKVSSGDIVDSGTMGSDDPSLGVFHHDFDGDPGVMKVFSAQDPGHARAFAKELSAARAAENTGYVRFLGEFDAGNATGSALTPARALGYGWQPGKSLSRLDDLVEAGDSSAYSRIQPHSVDQVKDFARKMAERGYVLGGDFQFAVDIDGNIRPFDLESFVPLSPPGRTRDGQPSREVQLEHAARSLRTAIHSLERRMPGGDLSPIGQPATGAAVRDPRSQQVPDELRDTLEMPALDPDKTQPFMQLPEGWKTHEPPPGLDDTQELPTLEHETKPDVEAPDGSSEAIGPTSSTGAAESATASSSGSQQGSYSMIDDVPPAGPGEETIVLVGTTTDVPGPGTLTTQELRQLQAIADEHGVALAVVGSRADGRGRNIDADMPHGKGPGTRSDIDVLIEGQHDIDSRGRLSDSIREMPDGVANVASSTGVISPPAIIIRPRMADTR